MPDNSPKSPQNNTKKRCCLTLAAEGDIIGASHASLFCQGGNRREGILMRLRLADISYYLLISIPIVYVGMLFVYVRLKFDRYDANWLEIPFGFLALVMEALLSAAALVILYKMATREKQTLKQNHRNLITEFLVSSNLTRVFTSDLYRDLQKSGRIAKVEKLTGGYSGAQVYSIYRQGNHLPDILKMAEVDEIKNEYQKFTDYVVDQLSIAPRTSIQYPWGNHAGLEYDLNWRQQASDHLTFLEIYKECLYEQPQPPVDINTIEKTIRERLFRELQVSWNWLSLGRDNVNIYEAYYPFTGKFRQINDGIELYFDRARSILDLNMPPWSQYGPYLARLLDEREWDKRREGHQHRFRIARATIHGDLNSRNILLEADPKNHNEIWTIGLVDFSHTGNGLTIKRTEEFIQRGIQLDRNRGHIANDFCRLEADIKFYLTDLDNEQELRQAWLLECLLLRYGLTLPRWDELSPEVFKEILTEKGLLTEPQWNELANFHLWHRDTVRKFTLMWQSVKAIRDSLREILQGVPPSMEPFYMALLQASLTMIYYEDHRFHNPNLQKLYLVLASALLCEQLLQQPQGQSLTTNL
ncbi:MAG: hypothetical protein AB1801_02760 [Chloroflexota bacterium]